MEPTEQIRFRDVNKPQVISGFERKLTYLMTYLMNYSYISELFDHCNEKTLINALLDSKDVEKLFNAIKYDKQINFKAFKLSANYKRKDELVIFGKLEQTAFPLDYDEFNAPMKGDLETFLRKLKVGLLEYLFNDSYSIILHEKDENDANVKFINKELRKNRAAESDFVELW